MGRTGTKEAGEHGGVSVLEVEKTAAGITLEGVDTMAERPNPTGS